MSEHTAESDAPLSEEERAVMLAPCACGHGDCLTPFESLLVERVGTIVAGRVIPPEVGQS